MNKKYYSIPHQIKYIWLFIKMYRMCIVCIYSYMHPVWIVDVFAWTPTTPMYYIVRVFVCMYVQSITIYTSLKICVFVVAIRLPISLLIPHRTNIVKQNPHFLFIIGHFKPSGRQEYNARKVNCSCVYSAYIFKPVFSGQYL